MKKYQEYFKQLNVSWHMDFMNLSILVFLVAAVPLSYYLPEEYGVENNFIENTQVVLLFIGALECVAFDEYDKHSCALPTAIMFLTMVARELSWGRAFLTPVYVNPVSPRFPAMSTLPYHHLIYAAIGISVSLALYLFYKKFNWQRFKSIPVPMTSVIVFVVAFVLHDVGEHELLPQQTMGQAQTFEELAEMAVYLQMIFVNLYYQFADVAYQAKMAHAH